MATIAIKYENIGMKYNDKTVITGFDLEIEEGEFVTIVGSSGSGKTTILKMVNALNTPSSGNIYIRGENIKTKNIIDLRRNIGYAIQGSVLFPHLTVYKNVAYVPNLLNKKNKEKTKNAVYKWLKMVDLEEEMLNRYPDELSGGQKQRVGIARALAASPDILLMDEPFGSVDEITRRALQKEIKSVYEKTRITVLFVTHDISEALYLGTKVLIMDKGVIQQYATPEEIKDKPANNFVKRLIN